MTRDETVAALTLKPPRFKHGIFGLALMASAGDSAMAFAQAGAEPGTTSTAQIVPVEGIEEVVVTAEKRSTVLQRTPISITAISGGTLQEEQVHTLTDLQALVPGLKVGDNDGYAQITVRGIGISGFDPGTESEVAVNANDVYIARPIAQLTGMFDVSSLEVLRGPQGTLYGRNATAGAVNVTTTRPTDDWSGYVRATYGNYDAIHLEGAVGGPLVDDNLLFRLAGFTDRHDGYGTNLVTGTGIDDRNSSGIRGTFVAELSDDLKATLIAEHYHERDNSGARHYFGADNSIGLPGVYPGLPTSLVRGGYTAPDLVDIAAGIDPQFRLDTLALTGIVEWSKDEFSLKSITGYRRTASDQMSAVDGGSILGVFIHTGERADQVSEELQAHYDTSNLHATVGFYFFHEQDHATPGIDAASTVILNSYLGLPPPASESFVFLGSEAGLLKTTAYAVFSQADYEVIDDLTLTAGLRYSIEQSQNTSQYFIDLTESKPYPYMPGNPFGNPAYSAPAIYLPQVTFYSATPKLGIQYQATPDTLVYALFQGFQVGRLRDQHGKPGLSTRENLVLVGGRKIYDARS